jgi:hypothetical protein
MLQNITIIYTDYWNNKYLQKLLKMPIWKAWVERPSGLIKRESSEAQAIKVSLQNWL